MESHLNASSGFLQCCFLLIHRSAWCRRVAAPLCLFLLVAGGGRVHAVETLIPLGATWRYLDTGIDQGTAWRQTNFNDAAWSAGPSQLGFGDGDEARVINGGPSGARYSTIYFRHTFVVTNRSSLTSLALRLLRDDGAVVFLNGVEAFRSNMPEGPVTYGSWAAMSVAGSEENMFFTAPIPPALLWDGTNVMAVEIHQSDLDSSDISFNPELLANTSLGNLPPVAAVSIASSIVGANEVFSIGVTASDPETSVMRIDVMQDGATIQTLFASSGTFAWSNNIAGIHEFTARAMDVTGMMGMSPPTRVLVTSAGLQAQSLFLPQFSSVNGLVLQNAASIGSNVLRLSPAIANTRGGAWLAAQQGVVGGFVSEFRFRITSKNHNGADGFAFVIAGAPQPSLGTGLLSYSGITNSLAIEFDTFMNGFVNDPDDHHISIHSLGTAPNSEAESASLGLYTPPMDFSDGAVHRVKIEYVPGILRVFLDNLITPMLTVNVVLDTLLSLPTGRAWIGLTAGCGSNFENHDIWTWSYTSYANIPPTVSLTVPAKAIRVARGTNLTLTAIATDPNGSVAGVEFYDGFDFLGEAANPPFSIVWSNPPAGIHAIIATATDDGNFFTVSAPVVVEVLSSNANVILFPDFTDSSTLMMQGSAAVVADRLRLTPAINSQIGGAWLSSKQLVEHGFETVFQFQISQRSSQGADGFAFVLQNNGVPALGTAGMGMGYSSIANSLAVEFDTHQNSQTADPDANHIGIHSRGALPNSADESASLGRATPAIDMSDGSIHTVVIRYSDGLLRVFLDDLNNLPAVQLPVDLGTLLNLDNSAAWVGFTSATGGEFENHDILMWSFRPNAAAPQIQLANPGVGPFVVPTNLLLSANASDPDGEITHVEFFVDGISIGEADHSPFIKSWNNPAAGTYLLTASATDEFGVVADSATVSLSVVERPLVALPVAQANGSVMIAFPTTSGQTYTVQYTADLVNWTNAVPSFNGTGALVSWHDIGPPVTDGLPKNQPQRFYRVIVSP